ncbi:MAG: hypothetical protein ACXAAM_03245 [Candidatus Heimdallarchaeaceae archaeon]|jgi:rRNA maturation endonuclease Nob1
MNKKGSKEQKYLIIDSTAIIHVLSKEDFSDENTTLVFPESIRNEIQSFQAEAVFETLKEDNRLIFSTPTPKSVKKVEFMAEKTCDNVSLSEPDLQVIAIALDFPNSTVVSDDNAIQNVCFYLEIPIKSYTFKIKMAREYYWKCKVCGQKYKTKQNQCIECGSPTIRLYVKKKLS